MIKQPATCALCQTEFEAHTTYGLCKRCWSRDRLREFDRLLSTMRSIRRMNVPCTLTLIEWLSVISDFQGKCAFCLVAPYHSIEMLRPAYGLVWGNVLPCCRSCSTHLQHGFETSIARVLAYLNSEPVIHAPSEQEEAYEPFEEVPA